MAEKKRGNWSVWTGVVAIFLFGAVTGVIGAAFYVHHLAGRLHSRGPRAFEDLGVELLDWQLDLDTSQEARVAEILSDVHVDLMQFKQEHSEEIDALLASGLDRIEETLTEGQKSDWDSLRARIEAAHRVPSERGRH